MKKLICTLGLFAMILIGWAQQPTVGVTMSGGGARAFSHLGVLQALYEYDIHPDIVAGTSMGAIIGAFYAQGYTPKELYDIILLEKFNNVNNILHFGREKKKNIGFSSHKKIRRVFEKYMPHNSFDSLKHTFYLCVANLNTGQPEYVHSGGNLHNYLLGSSSIPALFTPVYIDSCYYVDGGILDNFPARAIRNECDILIGIESGSELPEFQIKKIKDVASRSISVVVYNNSLPGYAACDYMINTDIDKQWDLLDFKHFEEIYQAGYEAAIQWLKEHPELVKQIANPQKKVQQDGE